MTTEFFRKLSNIITEASGSSAFSDALTAKGWKISLKGTINDYYSHPDYKDIVVELYPSQPNIAIVDIKNPNDSGGKHLYGQYEGLTCNSIDELQATIEKGAKLAAAYIKAYRDEIIASNKRWDKLTPSQQDFSIRSTPNPNFNKLASNKPTPEHLRGGQERSDSKRSGL